MARRLSRALGRLIFYALLALIPLVAVPYGTVEPWWEALFEGAVFILGALWMVEGMLGGRWLTREHKVFLPLLLLALFAFIQTLPLPQGNSPARSLQVWSAVSADPYETQLTTLKLLALTLAGALLLRYTSNKQRLRALVLTIIGIGIVSALFGIIRQTTQHGAAGFILTHLPPDSGYGQFINRNHFAFLMEMALGLVLGLAVGGDARRDRLLLYAAAALPLWTSLVLSNSRGGILAMLAQVVFIALLFTAARSNREALGEGRSTRSSGWGRVSRWFVVRVILTTGLIVMILVGALWMGGDPLASRLETVPGEVMARADEAREGASRREIWRATWNLIRDHPVAGVGFGGYWAAIPQYHEASGEVTPQQAHNDYLELLASGGVIGLALAAWFAFALLKQARARLRSPDPFRRGVCFGALAGMFGAAVHSAVDFGLHVTVNALVFTALVAAAVADIQTEDGARSSSAEVAR